MVAQGLRVKHLRVTIQMKSISTSASFGTLHQAVDKILVSASGAVYYDVRGGSNL